MSTVPNSTERCTECGRNPRTINSDMSECSVIECPHRRRCSSEGPCDRAVVPGGDWSPFDRLFEKTEG